MVVQCADVFKHGLFSEPFRGSRNCAGHGLVREEKKRDETQTFDNKSSSSDMSATAHVYGLLDRVGDALAEERERLELKAIEMTRRNNEQTVAGSIA